MRGITDTVKHLLIINVIVYIGANVIGNGETLYKLFALYFPKNSLFEPWQIFTHMFMHASLKHPVGIMHILFNMFTLWMFGTAVEQALGQKKFLFFYLTCGLGAAIVMLTFYYIKYIPMEADLLSSGITKQDIDFMLSNNKLVDGVSEVQKLKLQDMFAIYNSTMVGASGAIFGVLVAFGLMFPESRLMLIFLPIPIKAKYFITGWIALDLFAALTGQSFHSPSNTAFMAHVGGALTGFLMMWYWKKTQFNKNRWN